MKHTLFGQFLGSSGLFGLVRRSRELPARICADAANAHQKGLDQRRDRPLSTSYAKDIASPPSPRVGNVARKRALPFPAGVIVANQRYLSLTAAVLALSSGRRRKMNKIIYALGMPNLPIRPRLDCVRLGSQRTDGRKIMSAFSLCVLFPGGLTVDCYKDYVVVRTWLQYFFTVAV